MQAFLSCIESTEYMRFRNTIVVLTRIADCFPILDEHGTSLLAAVEAASKAEKREDLKILVQGLLATLRKHEKSWVANMKGDKRKLPPPKPAAAPKVEVKPKPRSTASQRPEQRHSRNRRGTTSRRPH